MLNNKKQKINNLNVWIKVKKYKNDNEKVRKSF